MRPMRFSPIRCAALLASSWLAVSLTGCVESSFAKGPDYNQQFCVERDLRRKPDAYTAETARLAFDEECRIGGLDACSALGVMNEVGVGVPVNPKRALTLYARACRGGNVRGCTNLAAARVEGIGWPRDPLFAARVLGPACDHDDPRACLYLARLHDDGEGTSRDPALAARLFKVACDGEEMAACVALAEHHANEGDFAASTEFYSKACSLGDEGACRKTTMPLISSR